MKKNFLSLLILLILLPGFGFACTPAAVQEQTQPIELNYWRVWDGPDAFEGTIAKYNALHPFIKINYKKFRYEEFEQKLLEGFATDRGPDIFSIHNTWLRKYQKNGLILPMPATISMVYPIEQGTIKKETILTVKETKSITLKEIKNNFADVVYNDIVINVNENNKITSQVYGLPLSVDTLVMFYNKDLYNNAGITAPSAYWDAKFQSDVKKLNKQNAKGELIQSGAALGGSKNIDRSMDILAALMMQSGAEMLNDSGQVKFNQSPVNMKQTNYVPGLDAIRFYTDFANPGKEIYSWNKDLDSALNLFADGKLATMFGYSYHTPQIKALSPKLNFAIAKLPQIEGNTPVNYANYWAEVVSSKILTNPENLKKGAKYAKNKADAAWDFIQFETKEEQAKLYLEKTKKPTALKSLINSQTEDMEIGVSAEQILTAKSWYKGNDANAMETIFQEMIEEGNVNPEKIKNALDIGAQKVQQTIE
ncbi:extracellular solute-binding protein [Candidatus Parcubacteria bacterium]|nr:extracellular solute-binding protein [Patescibacteria group bacterium]MBU4309594.1 extracellular solute-binding protein [Patescibacteria group bacterium]MBU4432618.1 extracellular solute-binding protein [Patescibacteria group bacterium]MBU4578018.1 extracellular solute-binding protein [Patescibacteria group bacterium]MCG2696474.1 extracellular solute-binding protein [Candidatus Parcubacteria bacterium]